MTNNAQGIINRALRDLGGLRAGQTTSTDIYADCFAALNEMLDTALLDELMVFTIRIDAYPLTAGLQSYTIGPSGANITAARPTRIEEANIIINTVTPVVRTPLELLNDAQWSAIRVQSIPNALPLKLYYDGGFDASSGFATLFLWPGPVASYQLELFTWQQLTSFANQTTAYNFPPGYVQWMRKQLAVEIAPMMMLHNKLGRISWQVSESALALVKEHAIAAKAAIQSYNAPSPIMAGDPAFSGVSRRGGWNYSIGESRRRGY